jgi:hypothetical protein
VRACWIVLGRGGQHDIETSSKRSHPSKQLRPFMTKSSSDHPELVFLKMKIAHIGAVKN